MSQLIGLRSLLSTDTNIMDLLQQGTFPNFSRNGSGVWFGKSDPGIHDGQYLWNGWRQRAKVTM